MNYFIRCATTTAATELCCGTFVAALTTGEAGLVKLASNTEDLLGEVDPLATAGATFLVLRVHVLLP